MFNYPGQAAYNKVLPKSKIYEQARPSRIVRDYFVRQIDQIVWKYVLATRTINLPARKPVEEIAVFEIHLKAKDLNEEVLRTIDKAVPVPIFFMLKFKDQIRSIAAYKRPSEADHDKWVLSAYFGTPWMSADIEFPELPVVLDMGQLYIEILQRHIPLKARAGESMAELVSRVEEVQRFEREIARLEKKIDREKQFNRKVEMNGEVRKLREMLRRSSSFDSAQNDGRIQQRSQ